jgi:predicted esterase
MEDFMIPFAKTISQQYALSYAEHVMKPERRYLIGGYSEGANLVLCCTVLQC